MKKMDIGKLNMAALVEGSRMTRPAHRRQQKNAGHLPLYGVDTTVDFWVCDGIKSCLLREQIESKRQNTPSVVNTVCLAKRGHPLPSVLAGYGWFKSLPYIYVLLVFPVFPCGYCWYPAVCVC